MTDLHKIVNGEKVLLNEAEIAEFNYRKDEAAAKKARKEYLQPLKDCYDLRRAAYGSVEKQMEILSEQGEQALGARNAQIKLEYPLTEELQLLKDSCTKEELKELRG